MHARKRFWFLLIVVLLTVVGTKANAQTASAGATAVNDVAAVAGNATATNAGNQQLITFQGGPTPLPSAPPVAIPGASVPSLFQLLPNQAGLPVEVIAFQLDMAYMQACKPRNGKNKLLITTGKGDSGMTNFVFSSHQNLVKGGNAVPEIEVDFSGNATVRCLGKVTISVTPKAARDGLPVDASAVIGDLLNSLEEVLQGVRGNVVLLSHPGYWAGGVGTAGAGGGLSLGIGLFNAVSALTGATIAPGASSTSGASFPTGRIGISFIVAERVEAGAEGWVRIVLAPSATPQGEPLGGNGRKAEAEKR